MRISLVIPVFNEEDVISLFYTTVRQNAALQPHEVELVFVNDGSADKTLEIIKALAVSDPLVALVSFSRNFGKEAALYAGLAHAKGDVVIPIDVDLQDPIEVIPRMLEKHRNGADVVLAKRTDRSSDTALKRRTAAMFYWTHNKISNPKIEENVGDFRLMSRRVVDAILSLPERQLFMKGLLSWVGFKTDVVEYARQERVAGRSKFNGWKLWNLAIDGFTSFSTAPLRIWSYLGALVAFSAFIYAAFIVVSRIFFGNEVPGYASMMAVMLFLGGVQLIGIGVLGEYLGRVYIESKQRPRYIIEETLPSPAKQQGGTHVQQQERQ